MEIKRLIVGMVQTNCYIAVHPETKEAVIVDPGDEAARIEDALAQTGAKAKAILLTHGHFDHVTAMEELRRDLGVPVYACEQEQAVLADPDKNLSVQFQGGGLHLKADMLLKDGDKTADRGNGPDELLYCGASGDERSCDCRSGR